MEKYLECGEIVRIHGLNGGLVVNHFCDSFEVFARLKRIFVKNGSTYTERKVRKISPYKAGALLLLEGIDDADIAMRYRGNILYADRDDIDIDEGSFFIVDLIGLPVLDFDTGEKYGTLAEVTNYGAQDIYVIDRDNGKKAYVPAIPEFVRKVSPEDGIFISPIEGMIE